MKRSRHTPEQVIRKLREADGMLSEGKTIAEAAKALEVSEQTYHRWRNQYGGMKAGAKRLKELARENTRLKRIVSKARPSGIVAPQGSLLVCVRVGVPVTHMFT